MEDSYETQNVPDNKAQTLVPEVTGANSLDKVRDILFGSQARDYEKRFARLEERLTKESSDLKNDVKRRFDMLESYIKRELETLGERLRGEQNERHDATTQLSGDVKQMSINFERRASQLDELLMRIQRELRDQMLEQSKDLSDDIRQKHESLLQSLERESQDIRFEKTDRSALASMFTEIAMRLNNEFKLPPTGELTND
jgi:hypothetical protein